MRWIFILLFFLGSCHEHKQGVKRTVTPAVYYWKSVFNPSSEELHIYSTQHIKKIYLRYFDVDWDDQKKTLQPIAQITWKASAQPIIDSFDIVPVVFITNESLNHITNEAQTKILADKITHLVAGINNLAGKQPKELQIDCDWTQNSKQTYFSLLNHIKEGLTDDIILSATIRLHQLKFKNRSGVPPVNRGMLMCYNMGNLKSPNTKNSIIEADVVKQYIAGLENYTLPMDIALPIFEWYVWLQNGQFKGLLYKLPQNSSFLKQTVPNTYTIQQNFTEGDNSFLKNDVIRYENSTYNQLLASAKHIDKYLQDTSITCALFDSDSERLQKFSTHEFETIFTSLR